MKKKVISIVLVFLLLFSFLQISVYASEVN